MSDFKTALAQAIANQVVSHAEAAVSDFAYKCTPKNASIDQKNGMYDISHVAVLGGEHD